MAWLRLSGMQTIENMTIPSYISATDVLHKVRHRITSYLLLRPMHPTAWYIYAWALCSDAKFDQSARALRQCLKIINIIRDLISSDNMRYLTALEQISKNAWEGLQRCESMGTILSDENLMGPLAPCLTTNCALDTFLTELKSFDVGKLNSPALRSFFAESFFGLKRGEKDDWIAIAFLLRMLERGNQDERGKVCDIITAIVADVLRQDLQPTPAMLRVSLGPLIIARDWDSIEKASIFSIMKLWYAKSIALLISDPERAEDACLSVSLELNASPMDDDHVRKSSFYDDNAGDERTPVLYALAISNVYISKLHRGVHASCMDVNLALRAIAMAPYMTYPWSAYWQGGFADAVLGSRLWDSNFLTSSCFARFSFHEVHQTTQIYRMIMQGMGNMSELLHEKLLDLLDDWPAHRRWAVLRAQADIYAGAGKLLAANAFYLIAVDEAIAAMIDPAIILSLELQALFASLRQYQRSNNYELLSEVRNKLDELAQSFPLVASINVLKAMVWALLKKAAKATESLLEAKALWCLVEPLGIAEEP